MQNRLKVITYRWILRAQIPLVLIAGEESRAFGRFLVCRRRFMLVVIRSMGRFLRTGSIGRLLSPERDHVDYTCSQDR